MQVVYAYYIFFYDMSIKVALCLLLSINVKNKEKSNIFLIKNLNFRAQLNDSVAQVINNELSGQALFIQNQC